MTPHNPRETLDRYKAHLDELRKIHRGEVVSWHRLESGALTIEIMVEDDDKIPLGTVVEVRRVWP